MRVIDSHTEGEPTRLILDGGPALGAGPLGRAAPRLRRATSTRSAPSRSTSRAASTRWSARCFASRGDRKLRRRADLLQQCRLSRHVRPCDDRRGGHARPSGPPRASARIASKRRSGSSASSCTTATRRRSTMSRAIAASQSASRVDVEGLGRVDRRRRLGRQLVLPDRGRALRARSCDNIAALTQAAQRDQAGAWRRGRHRRATARRSTMSNSSVRRARPAPTAAISCSAPAAPTTARPAAPAPAPSSPALPPTASSRRAHAGCRKASSAGVSRRATGRAPKAGSFRALVAGRSSALRPR